MSIAVSVLTTSRVARNNGIGVRQERNLYWLLNVFQTD
jgi:hypothetical protein